MKPSARARQQLPVLSEFLGQLAYVAAKLPEAAAREMVLAVQFDWRRAVDPYGNAQPPVRMTRSARGGLARRYDPARHIADSYYPVVSSDGLAIIASDHKASAALQKAYRRRPARHSHPIEGQGLGAWEKRFTKMHRDLLKGALMGATVRERLKAEAATRRQVRFEARNAARIRAGLKPLAPRKPRGDRARINALVLRAVG